MKLRLKPNSIRFRLNQLDVNTFLQTGRLSEKIVFPAGSNDLVFSLQVSRRAAACRVRFRRGELTVIVQKNDVESWSADAEQIGLYYDLALEAGGSLRIMLEKDLQCIDGPPDEIDKHAYPNPSKECK